ncbi:MAG: hypothetical protein GY820_02695 [Gammaproteobacteria bacterium]|nr:hypothetical protein [Gammaproteobacteria bacterium]
MSRRGVKASLYYEALTKCDVLHFRWHFCLVNVRLAYFDDAPINGQTPTLIQVQQLNDKVAENASVSDHTATAARIVGNEIRLCSQGFDLTM